MTNTSSLLTESAIAAPKRGASVSKQTLAILLAALCLLCTLAAEEWLSIRQLSTTYDESAHLYAGYQHWMARDFGVNPEHPPLAKLVAALPLLGMMIKPSDPPRFLFLAEEYAGGEQMLAENGNYRLLTKARMAASLFTFALALLVFAAGWEMFGAPVGLLALALFTFEPTILAHGALVTTDMAVACSIFAAVYGFYRYLKARSWLWLVICGLAVGLALSAKVSGVLVLPALSLMAVREIAVQSERRPRRAASLTGALLAICSIAYVVLWGFYTFRYSARPGGLALNPPLAAMTHMGLSGWESSLVMRLAALHLLPEAYLYAWVKLSTPFTSGAAFLFGKIYPDGTWSYFPFALLIKTSLTLIVLLAIAPFVLKRSGREAAIPAIALLTLLFAVLPSHVNTGVRHVLAIYPFAVLLAAAALWAIARRSRVTAVLGAALLLFQVATSLHAYPDYLPYANEAFGGSSNTFRLLADSNVDWAQQLKQVNAWTASHHVTDCWFAYSYMDGVPAYDRTPCRPMPTGLGMISQHTVPVLPAHVSGTVLISAVDADGVLWGPGSLNPYAQFRDGHAVEMIGHSILVYQGAFDVPMIAAESHLSQVATLLHMGQLDAAQKEVDAALAADPESPSIQADAGAAFLKMGKAMEARRAFAASMQESSRLSPEKAKAVTDRIAQAQHPPM
jgi:4-amino-4-deoxy-L-arabinose transferase-like glycosyltransferase